VPQNAVFEDFKVEHNFPGLGVRTIMLNARRVEARPGHSPLILLALEDVTGRDPSCKGQDHEKKG